MQTSEEPFQTFGSEISSISAPTEWFKKPQTVEGFLDEQIQTSTLLEAATATIQSQTSASLRSNMFLGRSIESRDFIPFPEVRFILKLLEKLKISFHVASGNR
jgi:hypothetical protein